MAVPLYTHIYRLPKDFSLIKKDKLVQLKHCFVHEFGIENSINMRVDPQVFVCLCCIGTQDELANYPRMNYQHTFSTGIANSLPVFVQKEFPTNENYSLNNGTLCWQDGQLISLLQKKKASVRTPTVSDGLQL